MDKIAKEIKIGQTSIRKLRREVRIIDPRLTASLKNLNLTPILTLKVAVLNTTPMLKKSMINRLPI